MNYKVFDDLKFFTVKMPFMLFSSQLSEWYAHPTQRAFIDFDNGWTVSVISGYGTMAQQSGQYELATMYNGELQLDNSVCKDWTPVAPITASKVSELMIEIQKFKPLSAEEYQQLIIGNKKRKEESRPFFW